MTEETIRDIIKDIKLGRRMIIISTLVMIFMSLNSIFYVATLVSIIMGSMQLVAALIIGVYGYFKMTEYIFKQEKKLKDEIKSNKRESRNSIYRI